jgi:Domain of unknown function (DUF4440)
MKHLMVLLLPGCVGAISVLAQTPDEDLWLTERAFERAITTKLHDAARPMFHADFLGVDADGSTYTADAYLVRRAAESLFFDVEDEPYPGGGVVMGTVLIGSSVQRFSHVWLQGPQGWRLVAAQASSIGPASNGSPDTTRVSSGDEADNIKDPAIRSAAEAAIIDALRRVQRAEHASDANGWAALTDDAFWAIGTNGSKDRKSARMGQIARQNAATPLPTVHDVQVRIYGDLAIMRYVQEPVRPPALRGTRLWVRHGAVWQQALNHATRLTQPASN